MDARPPLPPDQVLLELDVRAADDASFAPVFLRLAREGIAFVTLAAAQGRWADWLERFTALDNATRSETGDPAIPRSVGAMRERLAGFELEPEACFVALDGDAWVGYTLLDPRLSRGGRLEQGWTGVLPAYRRRGIATALKALGIGYARANGFRAIVTAPRRRNLPSLGMSTKAGFRPAEP